jgi:hypothetical protein
MNDKQKDYMNKQQVKVFNDLSNTFNLPVFEDEIAEDELPSQYNYFLVVYGDFTSTNSHGQLSQEVYVVYVSEDNADVETTTLDIISTMSLVPGFTFNRTVKERVQKDEQDDYIDQVTIIFRRKISYEC